MENFNQKTQLVWSIADILRGGWKQHEYQDVILPLLVLKRLDSLLLESKEKVQQQYNAYKGRVNLDPILKQTAGVGFYNTSDYTFERLLEDPRHIAKNLRHYIQSFSENIQEIFAKFDFERQLERLEGGNVLYEIIKELNKVDLHPSRVDNHQMGSIFEELLRRFSEMSNETAGEHYTPRDVIALMAELMITPDLKNLERKHLITKVYDCCCGTGGMLSVTKELISEKTKQKPDVYLFGQELNAVSYAMCKADMLIKGEDPNNIKGGDKDHSQASTLSNDQFFGATFDYLISNPPYGSDWKKDKEAVLRESSRGFAGRFGAGVPRISDGQLLFLQHMISKMRQEKDGGARIAIIFNGSPLFTGDAGSGESEIRRWILEKDLLEAIVALPDQLFYNTGINTYVWLLSNRKDKERKGKVQLIDARTFLEKRRKSLGNKRNDIGLAGREKILKLYQDFKDGEQSKIFNTTEFAFRQITVERPLRLKFEMTGEKVIEVCHMLGIDLKEAINRVHDNRSLSKKTRGTVLAHGVEKQTNKSEEQLEIQMSIARVITSLKDKKWINREKFVADVSERFALETATKPAQKFLKTIVDIVGERDENAEICKDEQGNPEPDAELRDTENVPWGTDVYAYFKKEVVPYVSDAWLNEAVIDDKDGKVGKVGYEIPFTRFFFKYEAPRSLEAIEGDIEKVENELLTLLKQL